MYFVIVNPKAGFGKAEKLFRRIQGDPLFKQKNCRSFFTNEKGHAEKLAEQIAQMHKDHLTAIVVIGGDGTLHEVLNGLHHYPTVPIGFIPSGTGNDFSRGMQIKLKGVELFRKIVTSPKVMRIYPGILELNGRKKPYYFLNSVGLGLDGAVIQIANHVSFRTSVKRIFLQPILYPLALVRALRTFKPFSFELEIEREKRMMKEMMMFTVTNHPYYGGGMKITPKARLSNPLFSTILIQNMSKRKLLTLFMTVFIGKHTMFREVEEGEAATLTFRVKDKVLYQIDGEPGVTRGGHMKKAEQARSFYWG